MAETSSPPLVSMAQAFTGLPMRDLIGGPLMAAAKANNQMAITQTKMILDVGFKHIAGGGSGGTGDTYEPILIVMSVSRPLIARGKNNDSNGQAQVDVQNVTSTIHVPLLSIIPINALGVDNVNVTFDMEVKSSYSNNVDDHTANTMKESGSFDAKFKVGPFSADVKGAVSHSSNHTHDDKSSYQKSNSAKYHVDVHAGQLPVPDGFKLILKAFADAIAPIEMPGDGTGGDSGKGKGKGKG